MTSQPTNTQSIPMESVNSSPNSKMHTKTRPMPDLNWWDILPLTQETRRTPAIHWTPQGIITAHPTKPLILLYPNPPNTSERRIFPSDRTISETDAFGPATVLAVSGSGQHVFAYFPFATGANSGRWCIWINMVLNSFETVENGEAIVGCWWLGEPRQIITEEGGGISRLPPLGPRIALQMWTALVIHENFTLQLISQLTPGHAPEKHHQSLYTNSLRKSLHATPKPNISIEPSNGYVCTDAAIGLAYSNSSVIIATRAELLPPPCLPVPEGQAMEISISSTTYLPHADRRDWEYTGTESTIQLCELAITRFERGEAGWDLQINPLSSIPLAAVGQTCCLQFVPRSPDEESGMVVDGQHRHDRYLLLGVTDYNDFSSPSVTSLSIYSIAARGKDIGSLHQWETRLISTKKFQGRLITAATPAYAWTRSQRGILISLSRAISMRGHDPDDEIRVFQIPSLESDERYTAIPIHNGEVPAKIAVSPHGTQLLLQSFNDPKQLGFLPYPRIDAVPQAILLRDAVLHALLSSQDIQPLISSVADEDLEYKRDIIDAVWEKLDPNVGGGWARWTLEYLRALLLTDRFSGDKTDRIKQRTRASMDILSLFLARSALTDTHHLGLESNYDPDSVWPLSNICSWLVEFTERVLCAASDYQNAIKEDAIPNGIDPILFILLNRVFLKAWVDALQQSMQFLGRIVVPSGSNSDSKALVTKAVTDSQEQSPVNFSLLFDALNSLLPDAPLPSHEWRKGYRALQIPEALSRNLIESVNRLVTPEIVSLLPLHVRMSGLNLVAPKDTRLERDIITKRPLADDSRDAGIKAVCKRCGGRTAVDVSTLPGPSRWRSWEITFERCICGGKWRLLS